MTTDRQMKILNYLSRHESAEVQQLSDLLRTSPSTIRRELKIMEENGLLVRRHGNAQLHVPIRYELPFEKRATHEAEAKRKIASQARQLIQPGQVIGLSGGTTTTELARQLRMMENITIVTSALNIALELQGQLSKRVMVTGGILNQESYELAGDQAVQSLRNVHLDMVFHGASGIDADFGLSLADEPDAVVGRAFKEATDQLIILADHSKIGHKTFARFCGLSEIDRLITDDRLTPAQRTMLETAGVEVIVAKA
ncbi:MAG: DeoR/GlpR transcriptional regulator [Anaerolineae bacterium]|nr:DeoR/GlpR transcriptional regulator [Anaerolineae bacterium]